MLRGALFFWWDRFLGRLRWSEGPRLSGRAFLVGFRTDFVTSVLVSRFRMPSQEFWPRGPKPQGEAPLLLAYVPD